jgi:hypothetical protein
MTTLAYKLLYSSVHKQACWLTNMIVYALCAHDNRRLNALQEFLKQAKASVVSTSSTSTASAAKAPVTNS